MPFINENFITSLSQKVDIISVISKRIKLTKKGNRYLACCPFHQEKTPSFHVSPQKQAFYCFGCGAKGGAINFVMDYEGLAFVDAVIKIADENNIAVEYDKAQQITVSNTEQYDKLTSVIKKVTKFYKQQLKQSKKAINYAKSRGISGETARRFSLGFAPKNWQNLVNNFASEHKELINLGLIKKNAKKDSYYDFFVDRLIFPIANHKSEIIALGGRVIDDKVGAKYLNSQASIIFNKSRTLYGLDVASKYSNKLDYLLVVEGYMDVISLHQAGITKVVATLGTAFTTEHFMLLKRNSSHVIFCFDGDNAGKNAATRILKIILPLITQNIEVNFLFMSDGLDPDDLIKKKGKKHFVEQMKNAMRLSEFLLSSENNFDNIESTTKFIDETIELINLIRYKTYKKQLMQGLATKVGQDVETISQSPAQNKTINKLPIQKINDNSDKIIKNYLNKITKIILNYPELANDELLKQIYNIKGGEVIKAIVDNISFIDSPGYDDLIESFSNQPKIYNELKFLVANGPVLNYQDSSKELTQTLIAVKKYQKKMSIKQKIRSIDNLDNVDKEKLIKQTISKQKL